MDEIVAIAAPRGLAQGHLATAGVAGPGVLLLPDYRGIDATMTAAARRLALRGYPTFVLDLLDGEATASGNSYEYNPSRFLARDLNDVAGDINAAVSYLIGHPMVAGGSVCVAGAGGAGAIALWAPTICAQIGAVSAAYPALSLLRLEHVGLDTLTPRHVALHLPAEAAELDDDRARRMGDGFASAGWRVAAYHYPGTRPGFLDEMQPGTHNAAAATLVWERTMGIASRTALPRRESTKR